MVRYLEPTGTPVELAVLGYDGTCWDRPANLARGQLTTAERMPSAELDPGARPSPIPRGEAFDLESIVVTDPLTGRAMRGDQFLDRRLHTDALAVVQDGRLVFETYRNGMTPDDRHVVHSCTKTLTTMMVGIAVAERRLDLEAPVSDYVPELAALPAWEPVTLQHVLDMAVGLDLDERYEDAGSMYWRYAADVGWYERPGSAGAGALAFVVRELTRRVEPPGTRFAYASYLTNLLPVALANAYGRPALELYEERIYRRLGAEQPALVNLDPLGLPIVEGHLNLTLRDFVRWGHLLLDGGRTIDGEQVVPEEWVAEAFRPDPARARAFARGDSAVAFPGAEYHNQTWVLEPGRAAAMLGIHGQFCWVDRDTRTMVVGLASFPDEVHPQLTAGMTELWHTVRRELGAPGPRTP
jgi:CubicO group peptidase (beta-lactamase class C family)